MTHPLLADHIPSADAMALCEVMTNSKGDASLKTIEKLMGGVDANVRIDLMGSTALGLACHTNNRKRVRLLLALKADPNLFNDDNTCPLQLAYEKGGEKPDEVLIKLLLDNGAKPGVILHDAARDGHDSIVTLLHKAGADLDSHGSLGAPPLMVAIGEGRDSTAKLLCALGANTNAPDDKGQPALVFALPSQKIALVQCLLGSHTQHI
jgi:ankyrin repeat protein